MPTRRAPQPVRDLMRAAQLDATGCHEGEGKFTRRYLAAVADRLHIAQPEIQVLLRAIGGVAHVERGIAPLLSECRRELPASQRIGQRLGRLRATSKQPGRARAGGGAKLKTLESKTVCRANFYFREIRNGFW
jgi:hypothetical protein